MNRKLFYSQLSLTLRFGSKDVDERPELLRCCYRKEFPNGKDRF